jgi:RNA polymerase sigma factor (sigma-70 family)
MYRGWVARPESSKGVESLPSKRQRCDSRWLGMALQHSTSISLLEQLRRTPTNQEAWRQFVEHYAPRIYDWCRHWGLQPADAEDVTQTVLTILAGRMKTFVYDPSQRFRAWLQVVTRHAWSAFVEQRRRTPQGSGDSEVHLRLETQEAREDLVRRLQEEFDQELLALALARVRERIEARTWEAFRLTALEHRPAAEVAPRLGMQVATVYVARSKVQKLLRDELARVSGE